MMTPQQPATFHDANLAVPRELTSGHDDRTSTGGRSSTVTPIDGWAAWTVVLCKPDATRRRLVKPILEWIGSIVDIIVTRELVVTERQILAQYADMIALQHRFPFDVAESLRLLYVGEAVTVVLAHGEGDDTAERVRALVGHPDPVLAEPITIRGYYGADSGEKAAKERRLVHNLVHCSDHAGDVERDFRIWFGPAYLPVLEKAPNLRLDPPLP